MNMLNTDKLNVEFREGVTERVPLIPRRYTLTHSDLTQDMYLTIGPDFVFDQAGTIDDEVLGEWLLIDRGIRFYIYLHMDKEFGQGNENNRYFTLHQKLPIALEAIRYGDKQFFDARPEMDQFPIVVYFLNTNPEYNKAENWGSFADYRIAVTEDHVMANEVMEYHILMDEKTGDVNGDGLPDKASVYGDKLSDSNFIHNIIIEIEGGPSGWFKVDMITELNGYNPTLFLGDFTKDKVDDILFRMDMMFNSMNSKEKGEYGIAIHTLKDNQIETIFASDRYNIEYRFLVEYIDYYKISILNVIANKLFILDISYKGIDYLSQYYNENGKLIKPVQGQVLKANAFIPFLSSEKDTSYDLLAVHRIVGRINSDILGYLENLLSWNGDNFVTICMIASTPGTDLIPPDRLN